MEQINDDDDDDEMQWLSCRENAL